MKIARMAMPTERTAYGTRRIVNMPISSLLYLIISTSHAWGRIELPLCVPKALGAGRQGVVPTRFAEFKDAPGVLKKSIMGLRAAVTSPAKSVNQDDCPHESESRCFVTR
jgi:hypothetical protein